MKQVLVIGIAGFSGRHFEKYAFNRKLNRKYTFTGIDKNLEKALDQTFTSDNELISFILLKKTLPLYPLGKKLLVP